MAFAELFAKTNYSFLEGASHPEEMVQAAHALGYSALGITDRGGVYGLPRAHAAAKPLGLSLVAGCEILFENGRPGYLLARNRNGYGNLCEFLSDLHQRHGYQTEKKKPLQADFHHVMERSQDLFLAVFAEDASFFPLELFHEAFPQKCLLIAARLFDGNDERRTEAAEHFSAKLGFPVVASSLPLFHTPLRKPLQDTLACIRHLCTLEEAGFRLLPNDERKLKTLDHLEKAFSSHPEWLDTTARIASECHFSLDEIRYHYPTEWLPPGETGDSFLEKLVEEGIRDRYGENPPSSVREQVRKELALIGELQYADYFLTIWDIVRFAKSKNILYQGRGSAANSIVCYLLHITAIDPIRLSLLFERFISRERQEPPDIDIDFEHERREEVIQYIYERYGRHRAAITAEVICFRRKSAFREVAKVFGLPLEVVTRMQLLTHRREMKEITQEEMSKELSTAAPGKSPALLQKFLTMALAIQGFPRHIGTHVGGFVLSHDSLARSVPIENAAMPGRTIIQWDKNDLDALGFVRVDVLGLGILTCIRKCFDLVRLHYGKTYTLATTPPEDPKVYETATRGDTVGVFQIESRAQMNMLPRLQPKNFYDLVVEISLVRPGPIQGDMVHPYLRRRMGKEAVEYAHPELEGILKKTYGVPLFQEQIMKMAMQVAGFTAGEADELRRAMGTWRRHGGNRLRPMSEKFCAGLAKKGISRDYSERIFSQIEGFAEYGFPESHAASFAILAYVSAYLRLYFPDAYLTAILNSQPMGFYGIHTLVNDGKRHGVRVLDVDILRSDWDNQLSAKGEMRLGFREVRGLSEKIGKAIVLARAQGPFRGLSDLATRVERITRRDLFLLAAADAFSPLDLPRRRAFWEIQALSLRESAWDTLPQDGTLLPEERPWEKIAADYRSKGISLYQHPMAYFRPELEKMKATPSWELKNQRRVKVAGFVICRQMPPTASGVLFITLEDEKGFINLVIWNKVYQKYREILITQSFLVCEGKLEKAEGTEVIHIIVDKAYPFFDFENRLALPSHDFA